MESIQVGGITVLYDYGELSAAETVCEAVERSTQIILQSWDLRMPRDCRVCVMTGWLSFVLRSAPWLWKVYVVMTLPLRILAYRRLWRYAGGWAVQFGKRRAIGVKPPHLLRLEERSIGQRIFLPEETVEEKVMHITCHELTHAFTAHLRLPTWLNEGLAMVTVDRLLGKVTVRPETIETLRFSGAVPGRRQKIDLDDSDAVVYTYVRGYWLTRFIEDTQQGFLRRLLKRRYNHRDLEMRVAAAFEMNREAFWRNIDSMIVEHFALPEAVIEPV